MIIWMGGVLSVDLDSGVKMARSWARCYSHAMEVTQLSSAWLACVLRYLTSSPTNLSIFIDFYNLRKLRITHPFRIPICFKFVVVQLCEGCCSAYAASRLKIVQVSGGVWGTRVFAIVAMSLISVACTLLAVVSNYQARTNRGVLDSCLLVEEVARMAGYLSVIDLSIYRILAPK